jgi:type I restriction enzyme S subunit
MSFWRQIMNEFTHEKLGDLLHHKKGFAFRSEDLGFDLDIPVVRLTNIKGRRIEINTCDKVLITLANTLNEYKLKNNDVIIATVGSWPSNPASVVGKIIKADRKSEGALLNQNAVRVRANEKIDQNYLFYLLCNKDFQEYIISTAHGSANQASITLKDIFNYRFFLPTIKSQMKISDLLTTIDNKIELLFNNNNTLEKMAEAIFVKWYLENRENNWEEKSLYDMIELIGGGTPKTNNPIYWNGDIPWLSGGDISNSHKGFIINAEKSITNFGLTNSSAKRLSKYSTVISARGTVGKYCLLGKEMAFSQSNYGIRPKVENAFFFTYLLIAHCVEELKAASYGTVFDTITSNTFKAHIIQAPSDIEIVFFEKSISSYFYKIEANTNQIDTLVNLRETLLPKLMNGTIKVNSLSYDAHS